VPRGARGSLSGVGTVTSDDAIEQIRSRLTGIDERSPVIVAVDGLAQPASPRLCADSPTSPAPPRCRETILAVRWTRLNATALRTHDCTTDGMAELFGFTGQRISRLLKAEPLCSVITSASTRARTGGWHQCYRAGSTRDGSRTPLAALVKSHDGDHQYRCFGRVADRWVASAMSTR
jgi:hypothetical protein